MAITEYMKFVVVYFDNSISIHFNRQAEGEEEAAGDSYYINSGDASGQTVFIFNVHLASMMGLAGWR